MDVKKKSAIQAYIKTFGNVTQTCKTVGIERKTFYNWKEADPEFKAAIENAQPEERFLDFLEAKAAERINKGSDAVLIFALKAKGKKRGWVERKELTGKDGASLFNFIADADDIPPITSEDDIPEH